MSELFYQLILGLQSSAWIALGKVAKPVTGKAEKNLEQTKITIDTLQMLKDKTIGNLEKEEKFISNTIHQVHINYLEEVNNEKDTD